MNGISIRRCDPFFIVSNPRSGSTLLASLLSKHSRLTIPPETHFFSRLHALGLLKSRSLRRSSGEFIEHLFKCNARLEDLGVSKEDILTELAGNPITPAGAYVAILKAYARRANKTRAGDKTPAHIHSVPVMLDWFPEARVICIVRDPRDVVQSLVNAPWAHSDIVRHAAHWAWCARKAVEYQSTFRERFRIFRYEDLIAEPERELGNICQFIGEVFESRMLDDSQSLGGIPVWEKAWKSEAGQPINATKRFAWKKKPCGPVVTACEAMAAREIISLDYEATQELFSVWLFLFQNPTALLYSRRLYPALYCFRLLLRRKIFRNFLAREREFRKQKQ